MAGAPLLEIQEVSKGFAGTQALSRVSLNIKPLSCDPQRIKAYIFRSLLRSFAPRARTQSVEEVLRRLGLSSPSSVEDRVMRRVLMVELEELGRNPPNGGMTL